MTRKGSRQEGASKIAPGDFVPSKKLRLETYSTRPGVSGATLTPA